MMIRLIRRALVTLCLLGGAMAALTGLGAPAASASVQRPSQASAIGYYEVGSDGGVFSFGDATFFGSMGGKPLNKPIVGMATTPDGGGYWLVASDGGVFSFGDAAFYGSMGGKPLNAPIVGMAASPDGGGYWLVASDGGIFTFGDAAFYGSTGSIKLNQPITGMAVTADAGGYWLVAKDGGIFTFGDAPFNGSGVCVSQCTPYSPIVGMAANYDSNGGYWIAANNGEVGYFPDNPANFDEDFFGPSSGIPGLVAPMVGIAAPALGGGYWTVAADGGIFTYGSAPFFGSMGGKPLNKPIVGMAGVG